MKAHHGHPGVERRARTDAVATIPWRWALGLAIFSALASLPVLHLATVQGRPWALVAALALPVAAASIWRRPIAAAAVVVAASLFLQLAYIGIGYSDQVDLGRAALERVVEGQSPYGVLFTNRAGGQNPFAYGPLAMLTAIPGTGLELLASAGLLAMVAATRSWLTLCLVAGFPPFISHAATGINDYTVALVLTGALLLLRRRPVVGMVLLACAAALKPYAAAWFLPAIGFAGWNAALWLAGTSLVLWSPVLVWGVGGYIESLRLVATTSAPPGWATNTIPLPWMRVLAIPLSIAGLFARRWEHAVLIGSAVFATVMFFGEWASLGYWVAVLPITGIAVERTWLVPDHRGESTVA